MTHDLSLARGGGHDLTHSHSHPIISPRNNHPERIDKVPKRGY